MSDDYEIVNQKRQHVVDQEFESLNGQRRVNSTDDLPEPVNGEIQLADSTAYFVDDTVNVESTIRLGTNTPILGVHGGLTVVNHTGTGPAIKSDGEPFFCRDVTVLSAAGPMFDLTADSSTEMLVESTSFASTPNLGTIDGYRVPTFLQCDFGSFDDGLTFDGSPDKITVVDSPFRGVSASNADILRFASSIDVDIVDIAGVYVKNVESDTNIVFVESGGEPTNVFLYRGVTHDDSVTTANILAGPNAGVDVEPFWVSSSYPIRSSGAIGEMSHNTAGTVAISTADAWNVIAVTSTQQTDERVSKQSDGVQQYDGQRELIGNVNLNLSFYGANGDVYQFGISFNGNDPLEHHTSSVEGRGQNANIAVPVSAIEQLQPGETVSIQVRNRDNANDVTILSYSFSVDGAV